MRFPAGLAWSREGYLVIADVLRREIYRLDTDQRAKPRMRPAMMSRWTCEVPPAMPAALLQSHCRPQGPAFV